MYPQTAISAIFLKTMVKPAFNVTLPNDQKF